MSTFFARGKEIENEAESDIVKKNNEISQREFAKRELAELTGILHIHKELIERVDVLQDEIRSRILKIESPHKTKKAKS